MAARAEHSFGRFIWLRCSALRHDVRALVPCDEQHHHPKILEQFGDGSYEVCWSVCPFQFGHALSSETVPSAAPDEGDVSALFFWNCVFDLLPLDGPSLDLIGGGNMIRVLIQTLDRLPNEVGFQ